MYHQDQAADIALERKRSDLEITKLTEAFHGGKEAWDKKRWLMSLIADEPVFSRRDRYFLGRTERFKRALAISNKYVEIRNKNKLTLEEGVLLKIYVDDYIPISLHEGMFLPVLQSQASEEQLKEWLTPAMNYQIIGCYAQTELGHGSNLSGLETTAILDKKTDEWVINSPHLSSGKFWIGTMGKVATHAVVQAKLIIDGKDYGTHPFLAQLRSLEDHKQLPGVQIWDIGPKVGANSMDNGFCLFTNYRIPRTNMLMRYSQVTREGKYIKPPHDKLVYGGMTYVRVNIVQNSADALSRAVTVAIRYSAVRRQGSASQVKAGEIEPAILDYPAVQYRLFPLLAATYAIAITGKWMKRVYEELQEALKKGDTSRLADVHAYSSALKSYTTQIAAEGMEESRRTLGGHGFSMFSGIPDYYRSYLPSQTYEGENWLLTQQTARYLLKIHAELLKNPASTSNISPTTSYLVALTKPQLFSSQRCVAKTIDDITDLNVQLTILGNRAAHAVSELARRQSLTSNWSDLNIDCMRTSRAHCQYIVAKNALEYIHSDMVKHLSSSTLQVLKTVLELHNLYVIEQDLGEHLEYGFLQPEHARLVRDAIRRCLKLIRPHAVPLVDAFGWPDWFLNSALGSYDGKAYERYVEWLKEEPLNGTAVGVDKNNVVQGYDEFIKPMIRGNLGLWTEAKRSSKL